MQNNEFILLSLTKSLRTYWSCITVRAVFCSAVRVRAAYLPAAVSLCGDGGGLLSALHRGSPVWIPRGSTTTSEQNHQLCLYEVFIYLHVHVTGSGRGGVNKGSVLWMGYGLFRRSSIPDVEVQRKLMMVRCLYEGHNVAVSDDSDFLLLEGLCHFATKKHRYIKIR